MFPENSEMFLVTHDVEWRLPVIFSDEDHNLRFSDEEEEEPPF